MPLAPAANPKAFTDTARVDKWFRRNCNDVLKQRVQRCREGRPSRLPDRPAIHEAAITQRHCHEASSNSPIALPDGHSGLWLALVNVVHADSGRLLPRDMPPAYTVECAACHIGYPPGLLPASSWQRIMSTLVTHYGSDASLDAATTRRLDTWLRANAGTYKRVAEPPPQDRITRSAWFERKHRKIDSAVWKLDSVKSPAHCAACHAGAVRGDFDDDDLRIPAGLGTGSRRAWND